MKRKVKRKMVKKRDIRDIEVVKSSYSPTKAELEEKVKLPRKLAGKSFDDIVRALFRSVSITQRGK